MSQIEVNHVSYIYDPKDPNKYNALDDISLNIEKGDFVALVGRTGSGKSTLIQTLNGLNYPTNGYVKVDDFYIIGDKKLKKEIFKSLPEEQRILNKKKSYLLKKKVGIVFQFPEYQLFSDTIIKDVMFGPKNFGLKEEEAKKVATEALKKVGIPDDYLEKSPFELSGGEKRRVAIAGIIASNPDILILDEPTAGLDSHGKEEIMGLVSNLYKEGKTIIIVTHDMDIVMRYASKVFVLSNGKLIKETNSKDLFNDTNLEDYSLEEPAFYKFKKSLQKHGFSEDLSKIYDENSLIDLILKEKKNGK